MVWGNRILEPGEARKSEIETTERLDKVEAHSIRETGIEAKSCL